jgi:large subunit ribosomal protein L13
MKNSASTTIVEIDATGQSIGRLASAISTVLQGKNDPSYTAHNDMGGSVRVRNAAKMKLTGKKLEQKKFYHYSGYPGGLRTDALKDIMAKDASNALSRAVWDMLPKNRLRKDRFKRFTVLND